MQETSDIFTIVPSSITPSTYKNGTYKDTSASIVFKVTFDRVLISRNVYSLLEFVGDIGGIFGSFNGLATVFSLIMNFNGVYHLLTSALY